MVRSIVEALAEYAKVQPDKLFLADGKVELTYLDAWKCVYGYAVHLSCLLYTSDAADE